ncbi:MAG: LTA synthase family protein [Bacteroidota bacterium]
MNSKQSYSKFLLFNCCIIIFLRIFETGFVLFNFGIQESLLFGELSGLIYDLCFAGTILLIFYPVFKFFHRKIGNKITYFFVFVSAFLTLIHFLILSYFLYQLQPLDSFLYKYSLKDILFTINTSGLNVKLILGAIFLFFILLFFIFGVINKRIFNEKTLNFYFKFLFISLPLFLIILFFSCKSESVFFKNKTIFFGLKSLDYYFEKSNKNEFYSKDEKLEFRTTFIEKSLNNDEFPLLNQLEDENVLKPFFNKFDKKPNIVFLIVEGLNDDYLHSKDVKLMPFLSQLKDSSLYWDKCFTLGERSFAAVPSLLGSLPYGEIGFTLQEKFPQHLSLVSILKANDYKTTFFYGQPGWFHNKYNFFKYNFCDEVYDNSRYDKKYKKIIVGKDNYFWGYDDKALFSQTHEIIEKDTAKNRLDVYFTGSMHSPFVSSEDEKYERKFLKQVEKVKNQTKKSHYLTYKRFYKSIPFTDDAFKTYFEKYKKRKDFQNTIFIITGDHPMTEIPPKNLLKRFHVPLIIYSPKLKKAQKFSNIVSHLDVYETLLPFLKEYKVKIPNISSALGEKLIVKKSKSKKIVFMNGNRELIDYYSGGYYISGEDLYRVKSNFDIVKIENEVLYAKMKKELRLFAKNNAYVCQKNKIIPEKLYCQFVSLKSIKSLEIKKKNIKEEYYNVFEKVNIQNKKTYLDVSFDYEIPSNSDISLVYTLASKKDSLLLWSNFKLNSESKTFQFRINLEKQKIKDEEIYLNVFFWNQKKSDFKLEKMNLLLFEK